MEFSVKSWNYSIWNSLRNEIHCEIMELHEIMESYGIHCGYLPAWHPLVANSTFPSCSGRLYQDSVVPMKCLICIVVSTPRKSYHIVDLHLPPLTFKLLWKFLGQISPGRNLWTQRFHLPSGKLTSLWYYGKPPSLMKRSTVHCHFH